MSRHTRLFPTIAAAMAIGALAAPRCALVAQTPAAPRVADVMSPTEMRETGVASLTPGQRAALDAWLARYTAIVERSASNGAQAASGASAAGAQTSGGNANQDWLVYPYGTRIAEVIDGGTKIALADGTIWEVYLPNRPATTRWAKGDYVVVAPRAVELNNEFFFQITNGRDGSSAAVSWKGRE